MDQTLQDIIYLDRCALHKVLPEREITDPDAVYEMAKKHSLTALTASALPENERFREARNLNISRIIRMQATRQLVERALSEHGIWHLALKGSLLYTLYPDISMREMSDVDILYDAASDIEPLMGELGFRKKDNGGVDVSYIKDTLHFEMHHALFDVDYAQRIRSYYENVAERLQGGLEKRFTDEDFYVYLIAHASKHYENAGTGLRTLTDIYVYCSRKTLDDAYIAAETEKLGLRTFEQVSRSLAFKLYETGEALTEEESAMLDYLAGSGVYGNIENYVEHGVEKSGGRLRYALKRVFPGRRECIVYYPFFYRWPVFLPVLWIYRAGKVLLTKRWRIREEFGALSRQKQHIKK